MKRLYTRALALTLAASLSLSVSTPAFAKNDKNQGGGPPAHAGAGKGNKGNGGGSYDATSAAIASLTTVSIHSMMGTNAGVLSVGAKPLPPGIAKNLARGKPLPPGIAKKYPPGPLVAKLPRVDGHEWIMAGTALILVGLGTMIVKEIIENVFD